MIRIATWAGLRLGGGRPIPEYGEFDKPDTGIAGQVQWGSGAWNVAVPMILDYMTVT